MIGTIMVANVFFVIIPGQKRMVADIRAGREPDPAPGPRRQAASVHNTYFTLPVLFVMISNHYPMTYGHPYGWAVLAALMLAGVLIRQFFVLRHKGAVKPWLPVAACVIIAGVAIAIAPRGTAPGGGRPSRSPKSRRHRAALCAVPRGTAHAGRLRAAAEGHLLETPEQIAAAGGQDRRDRRQRIHADRQPHADDGRRARARRRRGSRRARRRDDRRRAGARRASRAGTDERAYRGRDPPFHRRSGDAGESAHVYHEDGALVVREAASRAAATGAAPPSLPARTRVVDCAGRLLVPGFIDTHVHYPQSDIIASYGEQLLEWLERYTFPTERLFEDPAHAREVASFFLDELLRNGTTTAMVFATVHPGSVDAIFEAAPRARDVHRRGQGADGPELSGVSARHGGIGLRAERGADRALARSRSPCSTR